MCEIPEDYCYDTTGDCVVGDDIVFKRDVWGGTFRHKHLGYVLIKAKIIKDTYSELRGFHTFTILTDKEEIAFISGKNLYRYYVYRKPWSDESLRVEVAKEKHERGAIARLRQSFNY